MDFMSDRLHNNIRFRTFNVIDDDNREVLGIDIGISIPSKIIMPFRFKFLLCHTVDMTYYYLL